MAKAIVDDDAVEIGRLHALGNSKLIEAVNLHLECGRRLLAKKESLKASVGHGSWLPWLEANRHTLGFDRTTAARLMTAAKANVAPAQHLSEALEISRQTWGHDKGGLYAHCSGNYEWFTPSEIIEAARAVMGSIDIDPASCAQANEVVKATKYFTKEDDGLKQEWPGTVFINPPFANPTVRLFAEKLIDSYRSGVTRQAVWLSNASTDGAWWHDLMPRGLVCFPPKRIKFYGPEAEDHSVPVGQSIIYMGDRRDSFCEEFHVIGNVMERVVYASD